MAFSNQSFFEQRQVFMDSLTPRREGRLQQMRDQAALLSKQRESELPVPSPHREGLMPCTFPSTCPIYAKHTTAYKQILELPRIAVPEDLLAVSAHSTSSASNTIFTPLSSEAAESTNIDWSLVDENPLKEKYAQDYEDLIPFRYAEDGCTLVRMEKGKKNGHQERQGHPPNTETKPVQKSPESRQDCCASETDEKGWDRYIPNYDSESGDAYRSPGPGETSRSEEKGWNRYIPDCDNESGSVNRSHSSDGNSTSAENGWDGYIPDCDNDDESRSCVYQSHHHEDHHKGSREEATRRRERSMSRFAVTPARTRRIWQDEARWEALKKANKEVNKEVAAQEPPLAVDEKEPPSRTSKRQRRHNFRIKKTRATRVVTKSRNRSPSNKPHVNSRTFNSKGEDTEPALPILCKALTIALLLCVVSLYSHDISEIFGCKLNLLFDSPTGQPLSTPFTVIGFLWHVGWRLSVLFWGVVLLIWAVISFLETWSEYTEPEESS